MFVKKDLRKVREILLDEEDTREKMLLARRAPEFKGDLRILCQPSSILRISKLSHLSLYGNELKTIEGIGHLSKVPLTRLNLGNNILENLPDEIGSLITLEELLLDDNKLSEFSPALLKLNRLKELRLSGNKISSIPTGMYLFIFHQFLFSKEILYLTKK